MDEKNTNTNQNSEGTLEIETNKADVSISEKLNIGFAPEQIAVIKKTVAKNTTNTELAHFLMTCKSVGLNPLNKEIWCYKDNKGNLIIFTGRDGLLRKAQEKNEFAGIRSGAVRENDEFEIDIPNGYIHHKIKSFSLKDRGKVTGGYALVFRKNGEHTLEIADFETYNKGNQIWKNNPEEMIKKVPEAHALKKAFGMAGVQLEDDFDVNNDVAKPINEDDKTEKRAFLNENTDGFNQILDNIKKGDMTVEDVRKDYVMNNETKKTLENAAKK